MKISTVSKFILFVAIFATILTLAACGGEGALKLESFTIDRSSIKTNYLVGEEVDFSGIKATAKYSDANLNKTYTFSELTLDYAADITATAGTKDVTVSFQDPHLNVKQEAKFQIKVTTAEDPGTTEELLFAISFEKPLNLMQFAASNQSAGSKQYGDSGFYGEFAVGDKTYVIGSENEFKLNPQFTVMNDEGIVEALDEFYSVVDVYVEKDGEYVKLTAGENGTYTDADGAVIVTVDSYRGSYQFTDAAVGKKVKISVLPSEDRYLTSAPFNPIVLEANVIRAYNVYEAWQLAVIDNADPAWSDFKVAHGISDVIPSGIVLHADISVTADDVPESYFYTTTKDVIYKNTATQETIVIPAGSKYMKDEKNIYMRYGSTDFVIEGNFFTIDTSSFPLVASPAVFGTDAEKDYKSDFSNTALFAFAVLTYEDYMNNKTLDVTAQITMNNLSLIGNAKRDTLVDENENLTSAGGLIFIKSSFHNNLVVDNIIGNSYFITYFADWGGDITVRNTKCYDSYQNAAFIYGRCEFIVENSYFDGCGGPVAIVQSVLRDDCHPTVIVTDSVMKTLVSGEEIWFSAVGATSLLGQIKGIGVGLEQAGFGNFVDKSGKMNVIGALMADGTNANEIVVGIDAQGLLSFDGKGINRFQSEENADWAVIKNISAYALANGGQMPPFLTVQDENGVNYTIYYNGTTFVDLAGRALGTDASHAALAAAFAAADTITLTQGGLSVVFELYHN